MTVVEMLMTGYAIGCYGVMAMFFSNQLSNITSLNLQGDDIFGWCEHDLRRVIYVYVACRVQSWRIGNNIESKGAIAVAQKLPSFNLKVLNLRSTFNDCLELVSLDMMGERICQRQCAHIQ